MAIFNFHMVPSNFSGKIGIMQEVPYCGNLLGLLLKNLVKILL